MLPRLLSHILLVLSASLMFVASAAAPISAAETVAGPVEARVVRVVDGDSFVAEALIWPGHVVTVSVRIRGIDAPEIRTRCQEEKEAALKSRRVLEELIGGATVSIRNIGGDKFFGRVLADVTAPTGEPVAEMLLTGALARPYDGGTRVSYCG